MARRRNYGRSYRPSRGSGGGGGFAKGKKKGMLTGALVTAGVLLFSKKTYDDVRQKLIDAGIIKETEVTEPAGG